MLPRKTEEPYPEAIVKAMGLAGIKQTKSGRFVGQDTDRYVSGLLASYQRIHDADQKGRFHLPMTYQESRTDLVGERHADPPPEPRETESRAACGGCSDCERRVRNWRALLFITAVMWMTATLLIRWVWQ